MTEDDEEIPTRREVAYVWRWLRAELRKYAQLIARGEPFIVVEFAGKWIEKRAIERLGGHAPKIGLVETALRHGQALANKSPTRTGTDDKSGG